MRRIAVLLAVLASTVLAVPCFAYSTPPVTDGLVGCWRFDEGSGVTAVDSSGSGNHGSIVNATYAGNIPPQVPSNYFLRFTNNTYWGNAYSYVEIPDNSSLRPSSGLTLAAWVKADTDQGRHIISKQYGSSDDDSYVLWYEIGDLTLHFYVQGGPLLTIGQPPANEWHHIVATYNGSFMRLYLDGVERTNSSFIGAILYDGSPVLIGADVNHADNIPDEGWNGAIDEVLIYNRSLNQAEIAQIIPEFPPVLALSLFISATIIAVIVYTRKDRKQANLSSFV